MNPEEDRPRSRSSSPTSEVGLTRENEPNNLENVSEGHQPTSRIEELLTKVFERQLAASTSTECVNNDVPSTSKVQLPLFNPASKLADPEAWCAFADEIIKINNLTGITLITCLSNALRGEAADWLIRCRPLGKTWEIIREEFLSVFSKPTDLIEMFDEAVNGRQNVPSSNTLLDEGLHVLRLALHLIKTRENDEALATLFACHFVGSRNEVLRRKFQCDVPKDLKSFCIAMRGQLGKRPALSRQDLHISPKRRAFTAPSEGFSVRCNLCGRIGHKSFQCNKKQFDNRKFDSVTQKKSVSCFSCGKAGHISTNCPRKEKDKAEEKLVSLCTKQPSPKGQLKLPNGKNIPFLFDSGSDCSLIRESCVTNFNGKLNNCLVSLKGIGGTAVICTKQILTIVKIEDINIELLLHVVPDESISFDIIIGRDLVAQNLSVNFNSQGLSVTRENVVEVCKKNIIDFEKINTDLDLADKIDLIKILTKYQTHFVHGFPTSRVKTGELEIRLKDNNKIVQRRPYRLSTNEREIMRSIISSLLESKIIRPSCSPFASPVILIKKKDGSDRLCVDFRELNSNTISDKYPLPLISDQINRLYGSHYFTVLDMASGFHQILIHNNSIEKTAFVTPDGQYEYLSIPFGKLGKTITITYIDDIFIPSSTVA